MQEQQPRTLTVNTESVIEFASTQTWWKHDKRSGLEEIHLTLLDDINMYGQLEMSGDTPMWKILKFYSLLIWMVYKLDDTQKISDIENLSCSEYDYDTEDNS